jgi:uncharacterized repeat protein (TIGR02543 family)
VEYNGNGSTSGTTASSQHTYGVAKALTANGFTRSGYTFAGWNTAANGSGTSYTNSQSVSNLNANNGATVTLYAKWTANPYTLTLNLQGGNINGSTTNPTQPATVGSAVGTLPTPTLEGYTFGGWYSGTGGSGTEYTAATVYSVAGNTTIYASWLKNYTITFDAQGGTVSPTSKAVIYKRVIGELPTPTRTSYTFGGWYNSSSSGTQVTAINTYGYTNNIPLYARWTVNTYTVVYNGNGSTGGSTASSTHAYGTAKALTANGFTKTNYIFAGWTTNANGTGTAYINNASVLNLTATANVTVTLYAKWTQLQPTKQQPGSTAIETMIAMKFVPNGSFLRRDGYTVTMSSFYMGEHEVTQLEWYTVMGTNPSSGRGVGDNYPVYLVSWNDTQAFIAKLNQMTGKTYRLPTEAEWEHAAREGVNSRYEYSGSDNVGDVVWYSSNSSNTPHPVKTKAANALGIYDMSGNVYEWCQDWYSSSYSISELTNPTGPATGNYHLILGGSYFHDSLFAIIGRQPNYGNVENRNYLGFRIVLP